MLDDEASELLRRHVHAGQRALGCVLIAREKLEREIGEARARDLDTWVEVNGGWVLPARPTRGSELHYAIPRDLIEAADDQWQGSGTVTRTARRPAP
jgi:hypothetical protein